jgi:hypothetical protein
MGIGKDMTTSVIAAKQRRVRRSAGEWRELFARFDHSGLTREAFCAEHGIVLSSFIRWRKKLRPGACPAPVAAPEPVFVELTSKRETSPWEVEFELGAGVVLRFRRAAC